MSTSISILTWTAAAVGLVLAVGLGASELGKREAQHDAHHHASARSAAPEAALYRTECGACHLAYPAELLPAASWEAIMSSLAQHYGDNAELDPATTAQLTVYLSDHAAGQARYRTRPWSETGTAAPLRISQTGSFRAEHHEIPARMVAGNPEVASFSRCGACHADAAQGVFDEHRVRIPGYGRWDD